MSGRNGKSSQARKKETIYLVPVAMVLALVPLVIRYHAYVSVANVYRYQMDYFAGQASDFMSWGKSVVLLAAAVMMVLCLLFKAFTDAKDKWKWTMLWIPLAVYGLMSFLSACFSDYTYISFRGEDELFESVWVLLAYCVCTVYGFYMVKDEKTVRKVVKIFGVGLSIICLYGLIEIFYKNLADTLLGRYLIYPVQLVYEYGDALELNMNLDQVFLTFYNSNYVGSYVAIMLPAAFGMFMGMSKKAEKIWFGLLMLAQMAILAASEARSGFFGLVAAAVVLLFFYAGQLKKYWKKLLAGVFVLLAAGIITDACMGFTMCKRMIHTFDGTERKAMRLQAVETLDDCVKFTYLGNTMTLVYQGYDSENPFLASCEGETVEYTLNEDNIWQTEDERFKAFEFAKTGTEKNDYFDVGIEGELWRFLDAKENGGYYYLNYDAYPEKIAVAPKAWGREWYGFASGRGYIWAKTVPMLKNTIILGSGPDTFYQVYQHNDYVSEKYYLGTLVTRPHSMYLQTGVQTGVVSLVAFLVFAGMYMVSSFRIYRRCKNTFLSHVGKGITAGIAGYLTAGLVNDSIIGISQLFWMLAGIGMAVNLLVKKQSEMLEKE